jgi:hypothetical protein
MKTNIRYSKLLAGVALALGTGLVVPAAIAGPGPGYWRNQGAAPTTPVVAPMPPSPRTEVVCTDARVVSVTETKFVQANGRGPMRTAEVGRKMVCTSCDVPLVVMKPSGHNARGAMAPVAIRGTHDCAMNGCMPARMANAD